MTKTDALLSIDFWDTLVIAHTGGKKRKQVREQALHKVASEYVENLSESEIASADRKASEEFYRIWFNEQRTPASREMIKLILQQLGIPATSKDLEYLVEVYEESFWEGPPELLPDAKESITELSGAYKLALISDTMYSPGRVLRKYLEQHELLDLFDSFLFSDEAGYSKPQTKAFRQMLDATGCRAEASYHIGDRLNTDIKGAREAGMKSILFTGVSEKGSEEAGDVQPDHRCGSWKEVKSLLL